MIGRVWGLQGFLSRAYGLGSATEFRVYKVRRSRVEDLVGFAVYRYVLIRSILDLRGSYSV